MKKVTIVLIALVVFASSAGTLTACRSVTHGPQDFVSHYVQGWDPNVARVVDGMRRFDDDFFAENYLVIFGLTMRTNAMAYVVESVQGNGDIILARRPGRGGAAYMITHWNIVIELNNDFNPRRFNVLFPDGDGLRTSDIPVRTYSRRARRTSANNHDSNDRQDFVVRRFENTPCFR